MASPLNSKYDQNTLLGGHKNDVQLRVVLLVLLAAVPVLAHHGGAEYDAKTIVLTGTVKEFQFTNPHSWIQVDVKDQTGKVVEWNLEWGSPNTLTARESTRARFPLAPKQPLRFTR